MTDTSNWLTKSLKCAAAVALCVAVSHAGSALAQDLEKYATKNGAEVLYDKGSVKEDGKGVYSFINVVRMSEENAKKYTAQMGYSDICHKSMQIMSVDCNAKSYVIKKVVDSDKNGKILNAIDPEDQKFKPIVSGSLIETMQGILCK